MGEPDYNEFGSIEGGAFTRWLETDLDELEWQKPDKELAMLDLMAGSIDSKEVVQCDNRVNLCIGPNASGKSTILRTIRTAALLGE